MSQIRGHKSRGHETRKRRHRNSRSVFFITVIVICIAIGMGALKISLKAQEASYVRKEQQLQEQIDSEKARAAELDELEAYMASDRYIEDVAREKLGMAYPNDLLLKAR